MAPHSPVLLELTPPGQHSKELVDRFPEAYQGTHGIVD